MKVRTQLLLAQLAPLLPLLLSGLITLLALMQMTRSVQEVSSVGMERVQLSQQALQYFREEHASLKIYRENGSGAALAEAQRRS